MDLLMRPLRIRTSHFILNRLLLLGVKLVDRPCSLTQVHPPARLDVSLDEATFVKRATLAYPFPPVFPTKISVADEYIQLLRQGYLLSGLSVNGCPSTPRRLVVV